MIVELAHLTVAHAQAVDVVGSAVARVVLAAGSTPDDTGDDGGESKKSGPLGLVVIIALCIGCYFLFKSMSKHLRRVRDEFPSELPADPMHPSARTVRPDHADAPPSAGSAREDAQSEQGTDAGSSG